MGACHADGLRVADDTGVHTDAVTPTPFACPAEVARREGAVVTDARVPEASGLAARGTDQGWWVHNDSGDSARLMGLGAHGEVAQEITLEGISARDFEDMARVSTDGTTDTLRVGDMGDNGRVNDTFVVHTVAVEVGAADVTATPATTTYAYGDGQPHDAEALMWDPLGASLWVITKELGAQATVFTGPGQGEGVVPLDAVGVLDFSDAGLGGGLALVTAADISADGLWIGVRSYTGAWIWPRDPQQSVAQALAGEPCAVRTAFELQGETLAFDPEGFTTLSEGTGETLWHYTWPPTSD